MNILFHELRLNKLSLMIWTFAISFMLGVCIIIYPEMSSQMADISDMFSDMGAFSSAFGMDQINFGEFMGYFGVECGNTLGLGGALFAAILGANAISKDEREHTAEFLLTHPISRARVLTEKLLAVFLQVLVLNLTVAAVSTLGILVIGVEADAAKLALVFLAFTVLQVEISALTFGISAFVKRGAIGAGLGLAFGMYFIGIFANLSEDLKFLKFVTPFGYADSTHIISEGNIEIKYFAVGILLAALGITAAYLKYRKKDIT